jgi:hypothetical protein
MMFLADMCTFLPCACGYLSIHIIAHGLAWQPEFSQPHQNFEVDLIAYLSKLLQLFLIRSFEGGGVFKSPVQPGPHSGKDRAFFVSLATNRDQVIKILFTNKFIHTFRMMPPHVITYFVHHLNGQRVDSFRLKTCTEHFEVSITMPAQQPFSHLAAGGISCTQKQYATFFHNLSSVSFPKL